MDSLKIADIVRDIVGSDRGINVHADLRTADGVSFDTLWDEYTASLDVWNEARTAIAQIFSFATTDSQFVLPDGENDIEFESESEFGIPIAGRANTDYFRMGIPLDWKQSRSAFTRKFLRDTSRAQIDAQHGSQLEADNRRVFRATMNALTTKAVAGSREVNENGVQIFDLWDGSANEFPPAFAGRTFSSTHDHYLVSGAASIDSGDVETLIDTIQEHGFGLRSSGEQIIIMVHPTQADAIATWRANEANANGATAKYDFIPSESAPAYLTATTVIGGTAPATFASLAIEGGYGDAWIHKSWFVPAGYVIAVATAGPGSRRNPLALREHPVSSYQGLRVLPGSTGFHPIVESFYERGIGFGVRHRSAAAVMQIKASGSYQNPTWP
jgi:hypothetical protein